MTGTDSGPDREMRVSKIENGTVIDHITSGQALNVLALLSIDGTGGDVVSVGINVPSDRLGYKDVAKIEDRELSQSELDVLSLIAPAATINIIRGYEVADKQRVEPPEHVNGVLDCPNPDCISTEDEPVDPRFEVLGDGLRCVYCDTIVRDDIAEHIRA